MTTQELLDSSTKTAQEAAQSIGGTFTQGKMENGVQTGGYSRLPETPAPIPTPTTALPSGVNQQQIDAANQAKYAVTDPNKAETDYTTQHIQNAQSDIDRINNNYDTQLQTELAKQAPINENNSGRVNALSALMGLSGSSSASTRTAVQNNANTNANSAISSKVNAERFASLNKIYDDIHAGALKAGEAALTTNKDNQKKLLDDVAANASEYIKSLALTIPEGKTFQDFTSADNGATLNALVSQTGKTPAQIEMLFNQARPVTAKSDYVWQGGKAFQYNPQTGAMIPRPDLDTTASVAGATGSSKIFSFGDKLFNFPIDAKGNPIIDPTKSVSDYLFDTKTVAPKGVDDRSSPILGNLTPKQQQKLAGLGLSTIQAENAVGIAMGQRPPLTGFGMNSKEGQAVTAGALALGYDMVKASNDWTAIQKRISTMNGTAQVRLQQAVNFSYDSLDVIEKLSNEWRGGQFPILNKANLALAKNGAYGQDAQSLATRLEAQINDLTSELGTVYKGGNSSTDESLKLAASNLNSSWSQKTLQDAINLARTNLQIRKNSIANSSSIPGNQYDSGGVSGSDTTPSETPSSNESKW